MKIPSGILLVFLIGLLLVLSAGCIGADYVPNRDIVIIKLDQDGRTSWSRTIDHGYDDAARDIIESPDGDLVIAGGSGIRRIGAPVPLLVRLSPDGVVTWDRKLTNESGELTSVKASPAGGFATVSSDGMIWRLDTSGDILWNLSSEVGNVWSVIDSGDEGFLLAGETIDRIPFGTVPVYNPDGTFSHRPPLPNESVMTPGCHETSVPGGPGRTITVTECTVPYTILRQGAVVKVGNDGRISWKRTYGAPGLQSGWVLARDRDYGGYLLAGFRDDGKEEVNRTSSLLALRLDRNGTPGQVTTIGTIEYYLSPQFRSGPAGFDLLFIHTTLENAFLDNKPAVVHIGLDGSVSAPKVLNASVVTTWTDDGGFFSAGFPSISGNKKYDDAVYGRSYNIPLHAIQLDSEGSLVWEQEVSGVTVDSLRKVMQTSDGGYVILALKEN